MLDLKNELKSIITELRDLLDRYIKIHDAIFELSEQKTRPLPFIFKEVGFNDVHRQAKQILSELGIYNQRVDNLIESTTQKESRFTFFVKILYGTYRNGFLTQRYALSALS